jgi:hypothetical protein
LPNIRVTQVPARTLVLPSDAKLRVTQTPVRTLVLPTDAKLRVTQVVLRVLVLSHPPVPGGGGHGIDPTGPFGVRLTGPGGRRIQQEIQQLLSQAAREREAYLRQHPECDPRKQPCPVPKHAP